MGGSHSAGIKWICIFVIHFTGFQLQRRRTNQYKNIKSPPIYQGDLTNRDPGFNSTITSENYLSHSSSWRQQTILIKVYHKLVLVHNLSHWHHDISIHQQLDCLFNTLFGLTIPPSQSASKVESRPISKSCYRHDTIDILWRHQGFSVNVLDFFIYDLHFRSHPIMMNISIKGHYNLSNVLAQSHICMTYQTNNLQFQIQTLSSHFLLTFTPFPKSLIHLESQEVTSQLLGRSEIKQVYYAGVSMAVGVMVMMEETHLVGQTFTHWGPDKMVAILQTTFPNQFSSHKIVLFLSNFHWSLFPRVRSYN